MLTWGMLPRTLALLAALAAVPAGAEEPAPAPAEEPKYAVQGWTPARLVSRGCIERTIRAPFFRGKVVAKFAVRPDGRITDFSLLSPAPADVAQAVETAVRACAWVPGSDADGRPVTIWVIVPIRFQDERPAAALRADAANPQLSREPREASPGCVRLHFASMDVKGMYQPIAVRFRVTPEGTAEQFSFAPEDLPALTRLKLIDAFSTCSWEPGLDPEGKPVAAWIVVPVEPKP